MLTSQKYATRPECQHADTAGYTVPPDVFVERRSSDDVDRPIDDDDDDEEEARTTDYVEEANWQAVFLIRYDINVNGSF